ncbi:Hypothetical protein AT6N2_L1412 [Agrobacterium tumefaciens]|nr:Hypothetical protein AT6N2_L1412 [Agrobacterium tumefaciens]
MFFSKDAVLRKTLLDKRTNGGFCCLIALRHRIIATILLVRDGYARAKARKRFGAGGIGKFKEEIPIGQHAKPRRWKSNQFGASSLNRNVICRPPECF